MDTNVSEAGPDLLVHEYHAFSRSIRLAFVTETYPTEVNGVS